MTRSPETPRRVRDARAKFRRAEDRAPPVLRKVRATLYPVRSLVAGGNRLHQRFLPRATVGSRRRSESAGSHREIRGGESCIRGPATLPRERYGPEAWWRMPV